MGHKILLADDSITIQKVIELTFSDEDFELHTVGNGQKAIDEIHSIMPDIVLCDIIMPEKNGYEVCEFIKSSSDLKHIPVLLLTGAFEPFDQERAKAVGCEGFLAKPFEPQTLISKVKELLESASSAPAASSGAAAPGAEVEETLLVAPPSLSSSPSPSAPAPPSPPKAAPPPAESGGLDEAFAIEAGERELSMDPGDHTVLLGSEGRSAAPPSAPAPSSSEDIWSQMGTDVAETESSEDDASTVFMAPPPSLSTTPEVPEDEDAAAAFASSDPDSTWQMPGAETANESTSSSGDFGGFEDFAGIDEAANQATSPMKPVSPPKPPAAAPPPPPPPAPRAPEAESPEATEAEPYPEFEPVSEFEPLQDFEPAPEAQEPSASFDGSATVDTVEGAEISYETPPSSSEGEPFSEPEPLDASESFLEPEPEILADAAPSEPEPAETSAPAASFSAPSGGATLSRDGQIDEALIDKIAQRVVDKLSSKVLQEIAWEVVPDLAEGLIQKEIDALKAKIPK